MKKIMSILLAALMLISLVGCGGGKTDEQANPGQPPDGQLPDVTGEWSQPLTVFTSRDQQSQWVEEKMLSRASWMGVALGGQEQINYPELRSALETENLRFLREASSAGETIAAAARIDNQELPLEEPYFRDETLSIQRADNQVFSILRRITAYQGGPHPDTIYEGMQWNTKTGQKLTLDDVFHSPEDLPHMLEERLLSQYPDASYFNLSDSLEQMAEENQFCWTLGAQGITFYFAPYSLASFSDGLLTTTFNFAEELELFSEIYPTRGSYVLPLAPGEAIHADLITSDNREDMLMISCVREDYFCSEIDIVYNNILVQDLGFSLLEVRPYLVHLQQEQQERNYIYLACLQENRRPVVYIYDLNGERPQLCSQINNSGFHTAEAENVVWKEAFHYPENFRLDTYLDILGTVTGVRSYRVDFYTGDILSSDDKYAIESDVILKTMQPIRVSILPHMGSEQIPAGTELQFLRTDGETFVEMETDKGRKIRIDTEVTENGTTINGIPAEDCISGMLYVN